MDTFSLPPMPDLGPVAHRDPTGRPEDIQVNCAGVLKMARDGGTPQSRAFYIAFVEEWERWKGLPLTMGEKQARCMKQALVSVGARMVVTKQG